MLIKIFDISIPLLGSIICLLLYMEKIPIRKNKDENKVFYRKYKNFLLLMAIALLIFCLSILIG